MASASEELLKFYRSEIKFEAEVLSSRLNAFIASQSFLVIAYATAIVGNEGRWDDPELVALPVALSILGLILAVLARPGILAANEVIRLWSHRLRVRFENQG